jgi:hypothetical protein
LIAEPTPHSLATKIEEFYEKGEAYFFTQPVEEKKKYTWKNLANAILELSS